MTLDEHYICQRAANAIISEIGPFRVSTDALQAINQFLDEFIVLLLTCSLSLDLSEIKSIVFSLLPSTLGKNAIVEAELEVKTFTETESIDYELYERMRNLSSTQFPLNEAIPLLREKCFEYCTLADKEDQLYLLNKKKTPTSDTIVISPIVAIYVTTVMEHIAEYLLTAVAMTAEHEETDYVRVKEVFLALIDDIQLGDVFHRMDLKDKMEKRAGILNNRPKSTYLPPPSPSPSSNRKSYHLQETGSFLDITFDELDLDYMEESNNNKTENMRPQSVMSNNTNRKSTFHLFKNNRNSFSGPSTTSNELPRASSPISVASIYDPDAVNMNFDDLIKSGGTVKVSLTPNRLRSIEIKDQTKDELLPPPITWERRSTSSPRLSTQTTRPSSPLVRQNTTSTVKSNNDSRPTSPLGKINEKNRFENPRDAPKPPPPPPTPLSPTLPIVSPTLSPKPTTIPSSSSNDSISSDISSLLSDSHLSIQEPPIPKPTKSNTNNNTNNNTINTNGMVMRRSSVSSKKSRENLRKAKEDQQQQKPSPLVLVDEPMPTTITIATVVQESEQVIEKKVTITEEPVQIDTMPRQVQFTNKSEEKEESKSTVGVVIARKKAATLSPERPSSMVAKRASMVGNNRRRSLHESFATEKYHHRVSTVGSVSVSIKQWDDILKPEEQASVIPPAAHRRSVLRQLRQQQLQEQLKQQQEEGGKIETQSNSSNNAVLDKVLKFERASSLDDVAHQRVSHMPRRERFLYLQQDPSAIERKSTITNNKKVTTPVLVKGIDQAIQTEDIMPTPPSSIKKEEDDDQPGLVDGDEEWFLQDDEWDEQEEITIVEWLLGE